MGLVCQSLHLVDGCEASFSQLPDWLVQLVKSPLVEVPREVLQPDLEQGLALEVEADLGLLLLEESEADFFG